MKRNASTPRPLARTFVLAALLLAAAALPAAASDTLVVGGRLMNLHVDVDHCEWGSTLCSGSGSIGPAADGNDSIVMVTIHLRAPSGGPITGLAETSFNTLAITNPGGVTPVFVRTATCAACFAEPEPGVYRLALRPAFGLWSAGSYVTVVEVGGGGGNSTAEVISIDIPF